MRLEKLLQYYEGTNLNNLSSLILDYIYTGSIKFYTSLMTSSVRARF